MAITVTCRCGQRFAAEPHLAGKQVPCPACGQPLLISRGTPAARAAGEIVVSCLCGRSFQAQPHLAGQRVACPACGQSLDVPSFGSAGSAGRASGGTGLERALWDPVLTASLAPMPAPRTLPSSTHSTYPSRRPAQREFNVRPLVIGGIILTSLLVLFGLGLAIWNAVSDAVRSRGGSSQAARPDYAEARRSFQTALSRHGPSPQEWQPLGSPRGAQRLSYQSGALTLTAYVDAAPADGAKRPAVLFLHGGFAFGMTTGKWRSRIVTPASW